jgi:hypothetical protein
LAPVPLLQIVAIDTALILMTGGATDLKQIGVFVVVERGEFSFFKGSLIHQPFGFLHFRVDFGYLKGLNGFFVIAFQSMTGIAFRLMTPFPVTIHTLAMVRPFEPGLGKVRLIFRNLMAISAGQYRSGSIIVMTTLTAPTHLGHLGMQTMGEYNRPVPVAEF